MEKKKHVSSQPPDGPPGLGVDLFVGPVALDAGSAETVTTKEHLRSRGTLGKIATKPINLKLDVDDDHNYHDDEEDDDIYIIRLNNCNIQMICQLVRFFSLQMRCNLNGAFFELPAHRKVKGCKGIIHQRFSCWCVAMKGESLKGEVFNRWQPLDFF